jgi:hypothetical protein
MPKYRKKPIIVEAEVYKPGMEDGWHCSLHGCENLDQCDIICGSKLKRNYSCAYFVPYIQTLEGGLNISKGDYIVTGIKGEKYPCKPDIFMNTYEKVESKQIKNINMFQKLWKLFWYMCIGIDLSWLWNVAILHHHIGLSSEVLLLINVIIFDVIMLMAKLDVKQ